MRRVSNLSFFGGNMKGELLDVIRKDELGGILKEFKNVINTKEVPA